MLNLENEIRKLEKYYTGPRWKKDFKLDENGLLPKDLKRGVLSEDGLFNLLDRFLVSMELQGVPSVICFNKRDRISEEEKEFLNNAYGKCTYRLLFTSAKYGEGLEELKSILDLKTEIKTLSEITKDYVFICN